MLVARLLEPGPGDTVADVCAAPGTKTTHLAQLMDNRGRVLAFDPQAARLGRVREAAAPAGRRRSSRRAKARWRRWRPGYAGVVRRRARRRAVLEPRRAAAQPRGEVAAAARGRRRAAAARQRAILAAAAHAWCGPAAGSSTRPARWSPRRTTRSVRALLGRAARLRRRPARRRSRRAGRRRASCAACPTATAPTASRRSASAVALGVWGIKARDQDRALDPLRRLRRPRRGDRPGGGGRRRPAPHRRDGRPLRAQHLDGFPILDAIRKRTRLPLDVHLMIVEPERYLADFVRARAPTC